MCKQGKYLKSAKKGFMPTLFVLVLAVLMVLSECALASSAPTLATSSAIIIVPDKYPSITAAIGNASAGDTILVRSGTYFENPIIDKSLSLQSEANGKAVVVGTGGSVGASVFTVAADNVKLSGFTITSANYSAAANYAYGVMINGNKCTITGNNIVNTYTGIFGSVQFSSAIISQNIITGNHKNGVSFYGGFNNTISGNNITGNTGSAIVIEGYQDIIKGNNLSQNTIGIGLDAAYSVIFRNNITANRNAGIYLSGSSDVISANYFANNKYGIYAVPSFGVANNNTIVHNDFVNNQQNAFSTSPSNIQIWDQGFPLGGNYWSDYQTVYHNATKIVNSGTMNSPYLICDNNTDKNPLKTLFDVSNAIAPVWETAPFVGSDHIAASWSFDSIEPNGVTADSTGANPAVFGGETATASFAPQIVDGKFGKALNFDGGSYAYAPSSPSLYIPADITIDLWVNAKDFKNVTYNNLVIESVSTPAKYQTRVLGVAITGAASSNGSFPAVGTLRGYVTTDVSGFNEIVTAQPVISLNQWNHVVFTRSVKTGMHLYVNGVEQNVTVTSGTQNPSGAIDQVTGLIFGHDSITTLDNVQILNTAMGAANTPIWQELWFWVTVATTFAILIGFAYYVNKKGTKQNKANT